MKTNEKHCSTSRSLTGRFSVLFATAATMVGTMAQASTDYGPAIWNPAFNKHWYTSGNGHKFLVCHDMEGYYLTTISYFQQSSTSASVHYCVNGKQDTSTDHAAGEITQMVREKYYAWHALCWNKYSFGTEHEGFASNPSWYTWAMYRNSGALQKHLATAGGFPIDRNHCIGHYEWQNANWVAYANANFGLTDATCCNTGCQTHTDPGQYWDWGYLFAFMNNTPYDMADSATVTAPGTVSPGAQFSATVSFRNTSSINTWTNTGTNPYRLGSQSPQDNTTWGFNRVDMPVSSVSTGQVVTFTFTCTAPTTAANYTFAWEMLQEGVHWFGPVASMTITVGTPPSDVIIDNPAATVVGSWSTGTSSADKYGSDYRYKSGAGGSSYLEFNPNISTAGFWNVYEWHPQGSNRTTGAQIQVFDVNGTQTVTLNQQINGGVWNLLGRYNFNLGGGAVRVTDGHTDTANVVMADAIKWTYAP